MAANSCCVLRILDQSLRWHPWDPVRDTSEVNALDWLHINRNTVVAQVVENANQSLVSTNIVNQTYLGKTNIWYGSVRYGICFQDIILFRYPQSRFEYNLGDKIGKFCFQQIRSNFYFQIISQSLVEFMEMYDTTQIFLVMKSSLQSRENRNNTVVHNVDWFHAGYKMVIF